MRRTAARLGIGRYDVDRSGPLFDGRAEKAVADACDDAEKSIATLGASMIRTELNNVLKVQTPIYRFKVVAGPTHPHWQIHDQGMVYGPWLEGTGSRNRTTRFKGYATFRRMVSRIQERGNSIAQNVVVKYLGRMQ